MSRTSRGAAIGTASAGLGLAGVVAAAAPAHAHGVGSRADLPLPIWLFAYSAAAALAVSFVALRVLWPRPRLAAASGGRPLPRPVDTMAQVVGIVARAVVLALFLTTVVAAFFGVDSVARNMAPTAFYVVFWVGMQVVSAVFGDVWSRVNPIRTIAVGVDRISGNDPDTDTSTGIWASHWPAAAGLLAFHWLELAYFDPGSIVPVSLFLGLYSGAMLIGATVFGAGWLRVGDGFGVLFSLLAALAPLYRDDDGRLRLRAPFSGLSTVEPRRGTLGVVLVILGGTSFDGVTRTQFWDDIVGSRREWALTVTNTIGLLLTIATVAVLFLVACRLVAMLAGDDDGTYEQAWRWVPSLVPIVLAYSIAHYFSLLVFEGQAFVALLSDPLGEGWDLFGTASNLIDFTVVSPNQIAYVQVGAIVGGHVAGVVAAHDRSVELFPEKIAVRSQYPMLAVMIAYTVGGLLLLLNA